MKKNRSKIQIPNKRKLVVVVDSDSDQMFGQVPQQKLLYVYSEDSGDQKCSQEYLAQDHVDQVPDLCVPTHILRKVHQSPASPSGIDLLILASQTMRQRPEQCR